MISTARDVIELFLLFYVCHSIMGLKRCYKTAVFYIDIFAVFLRQFIVVHDTNIMVLKNKAAMLEFYPWF